MAIHCGESNQNAECIDVTPLLFQATFPMEYVKTIAHFLLLALLRQAIENAHSVPHLESMRNPSRAFASLQC